MASEEITSEPTWFDNDAFSADETRRPSTTTTLQLEFDSDKEEKDVGVTTARWVHNEKASDTISAVVSSVQSATEQESRPERVVIASEGRSRHLGILLAFIAAIIYSLSALMIKMLNYHAYNLGVWRFSTMIIITLPFLIHGKFLEKKNPNGQQEREMSEFSEGTQERNEEVSENTGNAGIFKQVWPPSKTTFFLLAQAVMGSNSIMFVFFGVTHLNIGDSIVIGTSAPVFVTIVAWIVLKEPIGVVPIVTAIMALVGVGIMCKPPIITGGTPMNPETVQGVFFSLASMTLLTFYYVLLRYLRKVHHALIQFTFAVCGLIQSGIIGWAMGVVKVPANHWEVVMIVGNASLAFLAQTCITLASKYEQAGIVAMTRTTEVIFCYIWQVLILHMEPDLFSIVGAVITFVCVVIAALRKTVMSLEDGHKFKISLRFLLL